MFTVTSVAVEFSSACIVERTAKANEDIASAEAVVAQSLCVGEDLLAQERSRTLL